jgi:hypothetical protein
MAELSIFIASHNFKVTRLSPRGRQAAESFCKKYVQWGWQRSGVRDYIHAALKVYAAATNDRTEFRFHINQLKDFYDHLDLLNLKGDLIEVTQLSIPVPVKVELKIQPSWLDREWQPPVIEYITSDKGPRQKFVDLQTGKGKAQPLDAAIKVPGGWKTMGDMQVGTEVIARDGSTTKVTHVHPQGIKDIYRITFIDGRSTECCEDHLWEVSVTSSPSYQKVMSTKELKAFGRFINKRCFVDLIEPEDCPDVALPIDPYVLGVILGDGHIGNTVLNICSNDEFIVNKVAERLPDSMKMSPHAKSISYGIVRTDTAVKSNEYLTYFGEIYLRRKYSHEKHVPEIYLHASRNQRIDLLQGLMDTDGYVGKCGEASYTSTSLDLAKAVEYLVRSLGGIAHIVEMIKSFTYLGERKQGRIAYKVNIRHKRPTELVSLPRKKERLNDNNQYAPWLKLRIDSVEHIGQKEAQCITIEHPDHLYVTNDFIVTHNSYCTMRGMAIFGYRTMIIVKPMYLEKWVEDMHRTMIFEPKDIMVIRGSSQLMALLMMAEAGELNSKIILLSNKTLQNWLKLYEKFKDDTLDMGYTCTPDRMCEVLGVGNRVIDEVHQDFHLNFKIDLYTNVAESISLSATLLSDDDFMNKMYEIAYPAFSRYKGPAYDKYIAARSVIYRLRQPNEVRYKDPVSKNYSHHVFEQWILKNDQRASNYFDLINTVVKGSYLPKYKKPDRCIIFCASIAMCTVVTAYLQKRYPHLDIRRYVEEDPWENLMEADISVTTLQSAGTAVDIPNLTTVILTTAVSSSQSNVQGFGRLRKPNDGTVPEFNYFVCEDIPKQVDYHEKKRGILQDRAISYKSINIGTPV